MRLSGEHSCGNNSVQYTIREVSVLWDKAPYMEEISPVSFRKFSDHVSYIALHMCLKYMEVYKNTCPNLKRYVLGSQTHL